MDAAPFLWTFPKERVEFWTKAVTTPDYSVGWPPARADIVGIEHEFEGKDVLEIGPGTAFRHWKILRSIAKSWTFADISPTVISGAPERGFTMESYRQDFGEQFDVVVGFYVLHHVRLVELSDFAAFVLRHLRPGGKVILNYQRDRARHASPDNDDGLTTTHHKLDDVRMAFGRKFEVVCSNREHATIL